MGSVVDRIIPASKRLDTIDQWEQELEQERRAGDCTEEKYNQAKKVLERRRAKEYKALSRSLGWDEPSKPVPVTPTVRTPPRAPPEVIEAPEDPATRKRRHLHYAIFWGWVLLFVGLYLIFGDDGKNSIKPIDTPTIAARMCTKKGDTPECKKMQRGLTQKPNDAKMTTNGKQPIR